LTNRFLLGGGRMKKETSLVPSLTGLKERKQTLSQARENLPAIMKTVTESQETLDPRFPTQVLWRTGKKHTRRGLSNTQLRIENLLTFGFFLF